MGVMLIWFIIAYLSGSVLYGKLFCSLGGVNIQKRGSGNAGYANVLRIMGWRYALPTLLCDVAKGAIPTYFVLSSYGIIWAFWVGVAAIIGHIFPLWFKFRGGKGVATGLGLLLVVASIPAAVGAGVYFVVNHITSKSSLASLVGGISMVLVILLIIPNLWWMGIILLAMMVVTLRDNLFGEVPDYG